ncbi:BT4734/BF3469 family protein [Mediterranea massiliensis]|uniref:BT4734/BF3469 family protein n=1 Tax=Mediterranea massiliensis TaxID=1841865 RepID=UPI0032097D12
MELKEITISCFPNVQVKTNPHHLPLLEILESIRKGDLRKKIERIRKETGHNRRNELKKKLLPAICFSGIFRKMEDAEITESSGIICIDLDNVCDLKIEKERLKTVSYVLSIFMSPSGNGLKVLVLHDLQDLSRHKDLYHHLGNLLGVEGRTDLKFDLRCSNISHPCMWSYDQELYLNKNATTLHVDLNTLPVLGNSPSDDTIKEKKVKPEDNSNITLLTDPKVIKEKILESHTLFEEYYSMYPGVRNNNLLILASFFYNDGIPESYAIDYLITYYSDKKNGFPSDEIEKVVHSAYH